MSTVPIEVRVVDVLAFRPVERGWQVLALRRGAGTRCPGSWEMVHGKVFDGEALPDAAARELFEETGLKPERLFSVTMHPFYLVPSATVQLAAVFAAVVAPDAPVVRGEEHDKHAWLTVSQARRRYSWPHERRHLDDAYTLLRTPEVQDVLTIPLR
ncbi:MAG: NUDIX domain-containing protein [Gemmatimonadaceae bacterium]|nr:NUDIX domain-containing protein [Gemmatimonadaceae bacterium]MCW5825724.1 NUDIX domain-containing protein [Gemmatimonadaceae bacterium]